MQHPMRPRRSVRRRDLRMPTGQHRAPSEQSVDDVQSAFTDRRCRERFACAGAGHALAFFFIQSCSTTDARSGRDRLSSVLAAARRRVHGRFSRAAVPRATIRRYRSPSRCRQLRRRARRGRVGAWHARHGVSAARSRQRAPATERTEVRVVFDADRLILGVICTTPNPTACSAIRCSAISRSRPTIASCGRSTPFSTAAPATSSRSIRPAPWATAWSIRRRIRVRQDFGVASTGRGTASGSRACGGSTTGWTAEVEIPFARSISIRPPTAWGINFQRTVRRKNEDSLWTGHARNQGLATHDERRTARGTRDLSQGLGLDVKPYVGRQRVGRAGTRPTGHARPATSAWTSSTT